MGFRFILGLKYAFLGGVFALSSCLKVETLPDEPVIAFKNFVVAPDSSGSLQISFQDGNGDVGLRPSDTTGVFHRDSTFFYNLFVEYLELQNGEWVAREFSTPLYYRIPFLTPVGQNKTLEGEIEVELAFPYFFDPFSAFDTLRFEVQLVDRAFNFSNTVSSPVIVRP